MKNKYTFKKIFKDIITFNYSLLNLLIKLKIY